MLVYISYRLYFHGKYLLLIKRMCVAVDRLMKKTLVWLCGVGQLASDIDLHVPHVDILCLDYTNKFTRSSHPSLLSADTSSPPADSCDIELLDVASWVYDQIINLNVSEFYLAGHNFGGLVALQLLVLMRGQSAIRCIGLVLFNTSSSYRNTPLHAFIHQSLQLKTQNNLNLEAFHNQLQSFIHYKSNKNRSRVDIIQQQLDIETIPLIEQLFLIKNTRLLCVSSLHKNRHELDAINEQFINPKQITIPLDISLFSLNLFNDSKTKIGNELSLFINHPNPNNSLNNSLGLNSNL
jgi:hypothetical protein